MWQGSEKKKIKHLGVNIIIVNIFVKYFIDFQNTINNWLQQNNIDNMYL